jgi:hypothetical protein
MNQIRSSRLLPAFAWSLLSVVPAMLLLPATSLWTPGSSTSAVVDDDDEETELGKHMEVVAKADRALRSLLRKDDSDPAEMLALVQDIQLHAVQAKVLVPARTEEVPEGDRDAFVHAFRREMVEFVSRVLELEAAILDGDREKASEIHKSFSGIKRESHRRFKAEDR